jgi:hypothetical protein
MKKKYIFWTALIFSVSTSFAAEKSFEFNFWTSPATKSDKRVSSISEHPCGEVAIAKVGKLPKYSKTGALIPELVFEVNPLTNKVLRQWSMPVDGYLVAVQGDAIYVGYYQKTYRINLNRQVTLVENFPEQPNPHEVQCHIQNPLYSADSLTCLSYNDLNSEQPRIMSYQMVCS